jgi:hypothetical protein
MDRAVTTTRAERRNAARVSGGASHILAARLRPNREASVVNLSTSGVLIEGPVRLLPGAAVDLQFETRVRWIAMGGRVVRSVVVRLRANVVCYRAAIMFEAPLVESEDLGEGGYGLPTRETAKETAPRVEPTRKRP